MTKPIFISSQQQREQRLKHLKQLLADEMNGDNSPLYISDLEMSIKELIKAGNLGVA